MRWNGGCARGESYCTQVEYIVASAPTGSRLRGERVSKGKTVIAELLHINPEKPEPDLLRYTAEKLTRGCVVAIPTDTLYGLAADSFNLAAVGEIYRVKGTPEALALAILVNSVDMASLIALDVSRKFRPFALTVLPATLA